MSESERLPLVAGDPPALSSAAARAQAQASAQADAGSGQASSVSSALNLANNVIGAGLLSLPLAMADSSVAGGLTAMALVGMASGVSLVTLARCCDAAGAFEYRALGRAAYGERFGVAVQLAMLWYTAGSLISYTVLIGDFVPAFADAYLPDGSAARHVLTQRAAVMAIVGATVLFPLSLVRKLDALKWASALALAGIAYTTFVIVWHLSPANLAAREPGLDRHVVWAAPRAEALAAAPLLCVAFTSHYNAPRYYMELRDRSPRRMAMVTTGAFVICFAVYAACAVCGYAYAGDALKHSSDPGDILTAYGNSDVTAAVARLLLAAAVALSFPLVFSATRASVHALLWPKREMTSTMALGYSLLIVPTAVGVGIAVPEVNVVLGWNGALFGVPVVFLFPGLMSWRLHGPSASAAALVGFGALCMAAGVAGNAAKAAHVWD